MQPEILNEWATLYHASCEDVLPNLEKVNCVVTDPPYGVSYQSAWRIDSERFDVLDGDDKPQVAWLESAYKLVKSGGFVICFCEWKHSEKFREAISYSRFHIGAQLIWDRVIPGMGDPSSRPSPAHDIMWFAVKGKYKLPGKRPSSVYTVQRLGGHELQHPTQKPLSLMSQLIRDYSSEGHTILDPFAGSGTTGIAAMLTGRKCILIEKDAKYCEVIRKRVREADAASPGKLFDPANDTSLFAEQVPHEVQK